MEERKLSEPILLELVKNAVDAIVDEMAIALVRTAYSNNLMNSMDMSCALCDAHGRLLAPPKKASSPTSPQSDADGRQRQQHQHRDGRVGDGGDRRGRQPAAPPSAGRSGAGRTARNRP